MNQDQDVLLSLPLCYTLLEVELEPKWQGLGFRV